MSGSSNGVGFVEVALFVAGPASGIFVYQSIQSKYRNRGARYMPERDVSRAVTDMVVEDTFTERVTVDNSSTTRRNEATPAVRAAFSKVTEA
ncbi:hypothetical protein [Demequina lutea]|uniref:Uncharacterized protein n=1 Tax=Demequina lutea TaxID=431489 RepID=A0A7Y9ZDG7_9MICO|nr:hypothetical protein [Demequina lutea]NYI41950.1 hypothetical protein [Demequina lutea]